MAKPKKTKVDAKDILILLTLYNKPASSISELANAVFIKSTAPLHHRLVFLEKAGLIAPPPVIRTHRSREVTDKGKELLKELRLISNAN